MFGGGTVGTVQLRRVAPSCTNLTGMIKKFITSKIVSAASGECFVLGLKLADGEAHALRLVGLFLFPASVTVLVLEWHHKAATETVTTVPAKRSRKHSRSRTSRR